MSFKHLFLSPPDWSEALGDEISRVFPDNQRRLISNRWWEIEAEGNMVETSSLAFSLQSLPNWNAIPSISIRKDADALALHLREASELIGAPISLQIFTPFEAHVASPGKPKLLQAALMESLKRKAKGLLAKLAAAPDVDREASGLVQITWVKANELAVSVSDAQTRQQWRRCVSRWAGGVAPVPFDKRPPSRAYRKLTEALLQMGTPMTPQQSVVDLGASPGGWAFIALERGAHVVAVDRSPLREDLMHHRRLEFIEGDAFAFRPEARVDWLIADVAAYPERTLELVRKWLTKDWCRSMVVTVKFVGTANYGVLEQFKTMLSCEADDFIIRKLLENKNEVTVMAWKGTKNGNRGSTTESDAAT